MKQHFLKKVFYQCWLGFVLFVQVPILIAATVSETDSGLIINTMTKAPVENTIHMREVNKPSGEVYNKLFTALENNAYFVIHEPDIGKSLARFSQRWGDDYNKNQITRFRSLVFLNAWHTNAITNIDPNLASLFPMHISLIQIKNKTRILFVLPSGVAGNTKAQAKVKEMEQEIIRLIDEM